MTTFTPTCCTAPRRHWPLPVSLPGVVLTSCRFDPSLWTADDFTRSAIEAPASIQRSVAKRQAEFLAGRLCARAALQALGWQGPAAAMVPAIGEDRAPVWPPGVCGAISHGGGWAGAMVAHQQAWRGLGMDMETLLKPERALHLHGEILTAPERARMAQRSADEVGMIVTLTFSLKESLFKALYPLVLKRFYFEHAEVLDWQADGTARLRLLTDLSPQWRAGAEFDGQFRVEDGQLLSMVWVPL
ncbi:4'-phosphopantetheinyl transferase superfamily protein [Pseudomonas sp. HR96]|uniref:4'-phosphopantetheinyl transferase family protein n=1 Tax=Pseudomonas sp. HR96 TaxID=1027966 RepID=UPI002A753457|nr:4'-phosphopantetheinyl transferase superfamily protein [Pseudomonas sp. HR96]WPO98988.1 4'-phosphopantetheinyl transferase superfamily protein [Pseudomonas sp. HR96]